MSKQQYRDWLDLDVIEDYDKFTAYIMPRIETVPNKHNWFKNALKKQAFSEIPKAMYLAIRLKQISKINEVDALIAHIRYLMRFSRMHNLRMLTNQQHEVAEKLLNVVGGKIGMYKKNIQSNRV